ncbi:TfoX/Sxy family protein [Sphingobacterium lactis]|uniref:TfoX/Sxy family protein n=1 Tax=Sphingobacterium lactis TaxID=797291 RepID=UPI003F7FF015
MEILMAYDIMLSNRVRAYLAEYCSYSIEEKEMFSGLAFLVDGKMCINISDNRLMLRFAPELTEQFSQRPGFEPMIMKGKELQGYAYIEPEGYLRNDDFEFWMQACLYYNPKAKASNKRKKQNQSA